MNELYIRISNDESLNDYILRLATSKKDNKDITWQGIADNILIYYGIERSESWVRRFVKESLDLSSEEDLLNSIIEEKENLQSLYLNLKKERVKLTDERVQNNAYIRKLSREETIKEIALATAKEMTSKKLLPLYNNITKVNNSEREAICCLSDWHYGLEFKNPWNEFSPDICKERVAKFRDKIILHSTY